VLDVVLDTDVLVAALLKPDGVNASALREVISKPESFNICFSSIMSAEYEDVLSRPLITGRGLQREAQQLQALLCDVGEEVVPKPLYALVYPDRSDRPFLEAAVYVDGLLLTNSLSDFPFADVTVMGPEDFLAWLSKQE
jgi:predicted nucleic acid-binding protein